MVAAAPAAAAPAVAAPAAAAPAAAAPAAAAPPKAAGEREQIGEGAARRGGGFRPPRRALMTGGRSRFEHFLGAVSPGFALLTERASAGSTRAAATA